ncbi:MAG TPA: imidazolonepropionase [Candidatus Thermoplasmatota archaeon]|nr:imidazolonepropionase [Candidatus Thermoplasmatota archaeon]
MPESLLLYNIGELCTLEGGPRRGVHDMNELGIQRDAAVFVEDGVIEDVGPSDRLFRDVPEGTVKVNVGGRSVVPGFVDAHTHAAYAGDRVDEFALKLQGAKYEDILAAGGGILHTVRLTREATRAELLKQLMARLSTMMEYGTTTCEVKSGYGLDLETEKRLLQVIREADERHPMDIVATFLGAHAVPPEFDDAKSYAEHVARDMVPEFAEMAEFIDVFCEKGVFSPEESRMILEAGVQEGMRAKVHADELALSGGSALASELGAVSADHLLHAGPKERRLLADADVACVLLPCTALSLHAPYANARALIDEGALVAIATDHNPNCPTESMPFAMSLACHGMRMTPAEALAAATVNGAAALAREDRGTIEEGQVGDMVILDATSYRHIPYRFGMNPVWKVVKLGEIVVDWSGRRR